MRIDSTRQPSQKSRVLRLRALRAFKREVGTAAIVQTQTKTRPMSRRVENLSGISQTLSFYRMRVGL